MESDAILGTQLSQTHELFTKHVSLGSGKMKARVKSGV